MYTVSIVGGSGYTGGELTRILLSHPNVQLKQVTSRSKLGEYIYQTHPNLRKRTQLKYTDPENLEPCDLLFLALPHGQAQKRIAHYAQLANYIVDLSADFRLRSPALYEEWYRQPHLSPEWLSRFIYGLPELRRDEIRKSNFVSGVGCNATAANLALLPLKKAGFLDDDQPIIIEIKVGSSEGGVETNPGSHHPERSGIARTYSAFGHRHTAEVIQEMGLTRIIMTMTSIDMVRGVLATAHVVIPEGIKNKDIWQAYREVSMHNPFIRIVKEQRGVYRVPEPKILLGSNYADLGFEYNEIDHHLVSICAIDNLMKGAAGSAVQSMNLMLGSEESVGLDFSGLHPV